MKLKDEDKVFLMMFFLKKENWLTRHSLNNFNNLMVLKKELMDYATREKMLHNKSVRALLVIIDEELDKNKDKISKNEHPNLQTYYGEVISNTDNLNLQRFINSSGIMPKIKKKRN